MQETIILDFLISQYGGDTFTFDSRTCSLSLVKEIILQGFQICNMNPDENVKKFWAPDGWGLGCGISHWGGRGGNWGGIGVGESPGGGFTDSLGFGDGAFVGNFEGLRCFPVPTLYETSLRGVYSL